MSEIAIISTREVIYDTASQLLGKIKATITLQQVATNFIFTIKYFGVREKTKVIEVPNPETNELETTLETYLEENFLTELTFTKTQEEFENFVNNLTLEGSFLIQLNSVLSAFLEEFVKKDFVGEEILRFGLRVEDY